MNITPHRAWREATFDLTAMIDVVLLLTIFFSMTSQFSETHGSEVDLPRERGDARGAEAPRSVIVALDAKGNIEVEGSDCTPERLSELLLEGVGTAADVEVLVRADRSCPSARLDTVVKVFSSTGVKRWKLATAGGPS